MTRMRVGSWVLLGLMAGCLLVFLATTMRRRGVQVGVATPRPNQDGLVVKLAPLGAAGSRVDSSRLPVAQRASFAAVPAAFRNPLFGEGVEVQIQNTSDKDVRILTYDAKTPFLCEARIESYEGAPLVFPRIPQCVNNLKYIVSSDFNPTVRLAPGASLSVEQNIDISWLDRFEGFLRPGKYTVQVVCSYYRMPGFKDVEIGSAPMVVIVTAADIQEWRIARAVTGLLRGDGRAYEDMGRVLDDVFGPFYNALPALTFRR